jgi:hypothetical protein
LLAAFLLAASTASAETFRRPAGRRTVQRVAPDVALAARRSAETFRPLAPGEMRFLGQTSAPILASVPAVGVTEVSKASGPQPRVISLSTAPAGGDPSTDTVVVASPRPDSSRLDAILTGAIIRIALEQP